MIDQASELVARAIELLNGPPYFNVATESDGQPWNTPVWAARGRDLNLYWSSWIEAVHSTNIEKNPRVFLTLFDSTRKRGTNNLRCLYLQCTAAAVVEPDEAREAAGLLYPGEPVQMEDFVAKWPEALLPSDSCEGVAQLPVRTGPSRRRPSRCGSRFRCNR